ncbi:unnamed protein product [Psylliodes chrysocephalus]|uniref:Mutator-like transposase domain-containing protein n=1 Tax=Psylliodes chrysocephalus TaxID=3402493 RepID=A0A9P0CMK5_9CUCU|nr:unnamed protein product [Psylliodes chrysocephala]
MFLADGTTDSVDINSALTLGAVSTGIGYSTLAEIAAAINMPMIAEKTYVHYYEKVADAIYSAVTQVMKEAGREEAKLAKSLGEVDGNGIPFITVVADGAWSKRLYNVNYNASSGVCKFVGGKRINFSKRNFYQTRCEAAIISFNKGAEYYDILHKAITGNELNTYTKKYLKIIGKRKLKICETNERKERRQELRLKKKYAFPDRDYGNIHEPIPDMDENKYNLRELEFLNMLNKTQEEIDAIEDLTKEQASSILWLEERQKRITKSNFGKICKLKALPASTQLKYYYTTNLKTTTRHNMGN